MISCFIFVVCIFILNFNSFAKNKSGFSDVELEAIKTKNLTNWTSLARSDEYIWNFNPLKQDEFGNPDWDFDDWDLDGLKNNEEIKLIKKGDSYYIDIISDPFMMDSDVDGINDLVEIKVNVTSAIRPTYEKKVFEELFKNEFNSLGGKKLIASFESMNMIVGENSKNVAKKCLIDSLVHMSSENINNKLKIFENVAEQVQNINSIKDNYNDLKEIIELYNGIEGASSALSVSNMTIDVLNNSIDSLLNAIYIDQYKKQMKHNLKLLEYLSKNSIYGPCKAASKELYNELKNDDTIIYNAIKEGLTSYAKDAVINSIANVNPVTATAYITGKLSISFYKTFDTYNEAAISFIEMLTYLDMADAIGKNIIPLHDTKTIKNNAFFGGTEYITMKENCVEEVNNLFAQYVYVMNKVINSELGNYLNHHGELFSFLNDEKAYKIWEQRKEKNIRLSSELDKIKSWLEVTKYYNKEFNKSKADNLVSNVTVPNNVNQNALENLLILYDEINSAGTAYKKEDGSYDTYNIMGYKPKIPALFDEQGNLWYVKEIVGSGIAGDAGSRELQIKYVNGPNSKKYIEEIAYYRAVWSPGGKFYADNETRRMFEKYEKMVDHYLIFKNR